MSETVLATNANGRIVLVMDSADGAFAFSAENTLGFAMQVTLALTDANNAR